MLCLESVVAITRIEDAVDEEGNTALIYAVGNHDQAMTLLFIERGGDVNAKNFDQWTALHYAAMAGDEFVAKLLIENGADVNAHDKNGDTPLRIAEEQQHTSTAELIKKNGGK